MKSKIAWTEKTWNPVTGCTWASTGCDHCYAKVMGTRLSGIKGHARYGVPFSQVMCHEERLNEPMKWKKPSMVFVNSMGDLFHDDVPEKFVMDVLHVIRSTKQHTYQLLTKRPKRMQKLFSKWFYGPNKRFEVFDNLWVGVTCENQEEANYRIPILIETPASVRWISVEPMLGDVNLESMLFGNPFFKTAEQRNVLNGNDRVDWVVCGGESGRASRPFSIEWARILRDQCERSGAKFFMKQFGSNAYQQVKDAESGVAWPEKYPTVHSKGGDPLEWPEDLRVREYPEASK